MFNKIVILINKIPQNFLNNFDWIAFGINTIGNILNIFQNPIAFSLWTSGNVVFLFTSLKGKQYGKTCMYSLNIITNIISIIVYSHIKRF